MVMVVVLDIWIRVILWDEESRSGESRAQEVRPLGGGVASRLGRRMGAFDALGARSNAC